MVKRSENEMFLRRKKNSVNSKTRIVTRILNGYRLKLGLAEKQHIELTLEDLRDAYIQSHGKCVWCGQPLKRHEVDHLYPTSKEGENCRENIAVSCPDCNKRKGTIPAAVFMHIAYSRYGIKTPIMRHLESKYGIPLMTQASLWLPAEVIIYNPVKRKRSAA